MSASAAVDTALLQRLTSIATAWSMDAALPSSAQTLLDHLVERVRASGAVDELWLLFIGIHGAYPTPNELITLTRRMANGVAAAALLDGAGSESGLRIVGGTVLDVSHPQSDGSSLESRLVREAVPRWQVRDSDLVLAAWSADSTVLAPVGSATEILVPWRALVILPTVPVTAVLTRYSCAAEFSGNELRIVGHDLISGASGALVGDEESERIARYLSVAKHAARVIATDSAVELQFAGLGLALAAQGLPAPLVSTVRLPDDVPASTAVVAETPSHRTVLCSVDIAPGENREAVLFAAQQLLAEGLEFTLLVVSSEPLTARRRVAGLLRRGRIRYVFGVDERQRARFEASSLFSVFVPTVQSPIAPWRHPVVRSRAAGRPVVTSSASRTGELARGGGCLTVDPRDDDAIIDAMRSLLTDSTALAELAAQSRPDPRTWEDYSADAFAALWQGGTS